MLCCRLSKNPHRTMKIICLNSLLRALKLKREVALDYILVANTVAFQASALSVL